MLTRIPVPLWTLLIVIGSAAAIGAHYLGSPWVHWIAKPAATLLCAAMALSLPATEAGYRRWVVIGLLLSTVGDVFLMLPGDWFLHGLIGFLLAHLAYLVAFGQRERFMARAVPFIAYAIVAVGILAWLWPGIPAPMRVPVVVYVVALGSMAAQAAAIWWLRRDRTAALAAVGGALFMASDSMIAIGRFGEPFDGQRLLVLATYWAAQWLIARSVARA